MKFISRFSLSATACRLRYGKGYRISRTSRKTPTYRPSPVQNQIRANACSRIPTAQRAGTTITRKTRSGSPNVSRAHRILPSSSTRKLKCLCKVSILRRYKKLMPVYMPLTTQTSQAIRLRSTRTPYATLEITSLYSFRICTLTTGDSVPSQFAADPT